MLDKIAKPCNGNHEHEVCMSTNAKRGQVYTRQLARAVVQGLLHELRDRGDERQALPRDSRFLFQQRPPGLQIPVNVQEVDRNHR